MKKIYAILAVAAVAACTTFAVSSYSSRDSFFEANVEALTNDEAEGGKACETRIKSHESYEVFYCAECDWVYGQATLFSSTEYCIK